MARIFIGPAPKGVTGQSVAFAAAAALAGPEDKVLYHSSWGDTSQRKLQRFLGAFGSLIRTLASRRVGVVYITTSRTRIGLIRDAMLLLPAKFFRKARIVNHLHGSDFLSFREQARGWLRWLIDAVYRRIDCSIVLHPAMADQYAAYPSMAIRVVPNFVPDDMMSLRPADPAKAASSVVEILFLSNLIAEKGLAETIRAVDALAADGAAIRLTIVGKEDGRSALEIARDVVGPSYEFGAHVRVLGPLYGEPKATAYRQADIFALPAYGEAFPLTALEAMAYGCALVLSDVDYLPSIFGSHGVTFVPPRSWEALRNALNELIKNPQKRMEMGRHNWTAAAEFTQTEFQERVAAVLDSFEQRAT